jgi:hypothetical protein
MQKYRADYKETQNTGEILWYAEWLGGPTLSKIENCRIVQQAKRRMVYVSGEANNIFAIPGRCKIFGKIVYGIITQDDLGMLFTPVEDKQ